MLSQFFIIGGISIGRGPAPWAPPSYAYACNTNLSLNLNFTPLKRQQTVKYLGIYTDKTFRWSMLIQQLSLQLARYAGVFCRIRNLVPTIVFMHRAGQRCFELLALIGSPQLSSVEVDMASQESTMKDVKILQF